MSTEVELKITADIAEASKGLGSFSRLYSGLVREITKPLKQIDLFKTTQESAKQASSAYFEAKRQVDSLKSAIAAAGQPVRALDQELARAERTLTTTSRAFEKQRDRLREQRRELRAAGIDTRNLAAEQAKLGRQLNQRLGQSDRQGAIEMARQNLGLTAYAEAQSKVTGLQRDLQLLQSTGKLSATELAIVGQTMSSALGNTRTEALRTVEANRTWLSSLQAVRAELLASGLAFGALALAGKQSFSHFASFEQQIAAIGTITNLTEGQLRNMATGIRELARDMGISGQSAAAAVYELLGSGVETGDALQVLQHATKAAIAGMSQTETAAAVGVSIINAYGDAIGELPLRFDQLFLAIQDGVVSFDELAAGLGQVLPAAAAAGVSFSEVGAAIARMTVQGIRAPIAITALRSAINQLAAPSDTAKKKMQELGIEWNGLVGTLQQISSRNIGFDALRQLIPDAEGRTAVLALTKDIDSLIETVQRMEGAAGTTERAYEKMKNTPEQKIKDFQSALNDLQISFGQAVAAGLPVVTLITDLLNAFNDLPEGIKTTIASLVILGAGAKAAGIAMRVLGTAFGGMTAGAAATGSATKSAAAGMSTAALAANGLAVAIKRIPMVAIGGWTLGNLSELYEVHQEMTRLTESIEAQEKALKDTIAANKGYQSVQIETAATAADMAKEERSIYLERLRNAAQFYQALAEHTSREDMKRDGPSAPVSDEAMAAARQASAYRSAIKEIENELQRRGEAEQFWADRVTKIKNDELKKIQASLTAQQKAYETANEKFEDAQTRRIEIEKRFSDLSDSFRNGKGEERNDFASMTDARAKARQALAAGDTQAAIEQAEKAAQILEAMRDAGENTYGFAGIADDLGRIAVEAAKLDENAAATDMETHRTNIEALMTEAEALSRIPVGFESDAESEEQTKQRLMQLAQEWAKYMAVPVSFTMPDGTEVSAPGPTVTGGPGFADGGYTGAGGKYQFAGIVHRGEYVQPKRVMRQPGARQFMELFRKHGMDLFRGYAEGGSVAARSMPNLASHETALSRASTAQPQLTPVNLHFPGQDPVAVQADSLGLDALYRAVRARKLRGR